MALLVLTAVYTLNFVDRQILGILAQPIKADLKLSDTQLGLLGGAAFAVLYALVGLPIARLAERGDRPRIIAVSIAIWSAFTVLSGFTHNFGQLLLARIGVGIGEAGGVPPSHSLISGFTPPDKRASALAIFTMGVPIGVLVGLALGGVVADAYGWRAAFIWAGLPGLVASLIAIAYLDEPRRHQGTLPADIKSERPGIVKTLRVILGKKTFLFLILGVAVQAFVYYGLASFLAPFFLRMHGAELAVLAKAWGLRPVGLLGLSLGVASGLAAALGTYLGGYVSDHLRRRVAGANMYVCATCTLLSVPAYYFVLTTTDVEIALAALALPSALAAAWFGPTNATLQGLVPLSMRATISAIGLATMTIVGLGLGPLFVGVASDIGRSHFGLGDAVSLQRALVTIIIGSVVAAILFWLAGAHVERDTVS